MFGLRNRVNKVLAEELAREAYISIQSLLLSLPSPLTPV